MISLLHMNRRARLSDAMKRRDHEDQRCRLPRGTGAGRLTRAYIAQMPLPRPRDGDEQTVAYAD